MKRLAFVLTGATALALAGCSGDNQDQVTNAELNQPATDDLNEMADQAAMDAANAEAAALGAQEQALRQENVTENVTSPSDADEQNVSGM